MANNNEDQESFDAAYAEYMRVRLEAADENVNGKLKI